MAKTSKDSKTAGIPNRSDKIIFKVAFSSTLFQSRISILYFFAKFLYPLW